MFCSRGVFFLIGEGGVEERIVDFFDWGMDLTEKMRILCGKICGRELVRLRRGCLSVWCSGEKPVRVESVFLEGIFGFGDERYLSSKSVQVPSVAPTMKQ